MNGRVQKQVIIGLIFILILGGVGYGVFDKLFLIEATCFDQVQNGKEEGVDCGTLACGKVCEEPVKPLQVSGEKLLRIGPGDYDFVAEIVNPHNDFGAPEVEYELTLFNGGDSELLKESGVFYILPGQTKYLILPALTTENAVSRIDFKITSAHWQKIESLEGMSFAVRRDKYTIAPNGLSSTLEAVIFNDSDFDFNRVDADILLRDLSGEIIAVNRTDIRTFTARTERGFIVTWPFGISREVAKIETIPTTNLFENLNFIKRYGSGIEKFQQY